MGFISRRRGEIFEIFVTILIQLGALGFFPIMWPPDLDEIRHVRNRLQKFDVPCDIEMANCYNDFLLRFNVEVQTKVAGQIVLQTGVISR